MSRIYTISKVQKQFEAAETDSLSSKTLMPMWELEERKLMEENWKPSEESWKDYWDKINDGEHRMSAKVVKDVNSRMVKHTDKSRPLYQKENKLDEKLSNLTWDPSKESEDDFEKREAKLEKELQDSTKAVDNHEDNYAIQREIDERRVGNIIDKEEELRKSGYDYKYASKLAEKLLDKRIDADKAYNIVERRRELTGESNSLPQKHSRWKDAGIVYNEALNGRSLNKDAAMVGAGAAALGAGIYALSRNLKKKKKEKEITKDKFKTKKYSLVDKLSAGHDFSEYYDHDLERRPGGPYKSKGRNKHHEDKTGGISFKDAYNQYFKDKYGVDNYMSPGFKADKVPYIKSEGLDKHINGKIDLNDYLKKDFDLEDTGYNKSVRAKGVEKVADKLGLLNSEKKRNLIDRRISALEGYSKEDLDRNNFYQNERYDAKIEGKYTPNHEKRLRQYEAAARAVKRRYKDANMVYNEATGRENIGTDALLAAGIAAGVGVGVNALRKRWKRKKGSKKEISERYKKS